MREVKIVPNEELEGWDLIICNNIQTEDGFIDEVMATFYDQLSAHVTKNMWTNFFNRTKDKVTFIRGK